MGKRKTRTVKIKHLGGLFTTVEHQYTIPKNIKLGKHMYTVHSLEEEQELRDTIKAHKNKTYWKF